MPKRPTATLEFSTGSKPVAVVQSPSDYAADLVKELKAAFEGDLVLGKTTVHIEIKLLTKDKQRFGDEENRETLVVIDSEFLQKEEK